MGAAEHVKQKGQSRLLCPVALFGPPPCCCGPPRIIVLPSMWAALLLAAFMCLYCCVASNGRCCWAFVPSSSSGVLVMPASGFPVVVGLATPHWLRHVILGVYTTALACPHRGWGLHLCVGPFSSWCGPMHCHIAVRPFPCRVGPTR